MASQSRSQQHRAKSRENTHHRAVHESHVLQERGLNDFTWASPACRNPRSGTAARPHMQLFCSDSPGTCLKLQGPASPSGPLLLPAAFCILENPPVKQLLLLAGEALPLASFWRAALKYRRKIKVSLTNLAKQNICSHRGTALTCYEHTHPLTSSAQDCSCDLHSMQSPEGPLSATEQLEQPARRQLPTRKFMSCALFLLPFWKK